MTPDQKVKRGHDAQRLLNDELFKEAWATLDAALITEWAATNPLDAVNRERYFHQLTGLRAVKSKLERYMQEGDAAFREIERTRERAAGTRKPVTT
jgi:hypothetical protein